MARPPGIRSRLILAFSLELALVAGVAAVGLVGLRSVRDAFQTAIDRGLEAQHLAAQIKTVLYAARREEAEFLRSWSADFAAAQEHVADHRRHLTRLGQLIGELERHEATGTPSYPPRRAAEDLVALKPYVNVYAEDFEKAVTLIASQPANEGDLEKRIAAFQAHAEVVEPLVDDIAAVGQEEAQVAIGAARSASNRTVWGVLVALLAAMATGITLATVLGHQITAPLTQLARTAKAIGAGDLNAQANIRSRDEIGTLAQTFNAMTTRVRALVRSLEERVHEREEAEAEVRRLNAELEGRVRARTGELESANLELEAFTYSVSHDLRTPLRHIAGFVFLLRRQSPDLDAESVAHLGVIEDSVERMGALIDGLLAFSRVGRAELAREPVDLAELIAEIRTEIGPEIGDRKVIFRIGALPELTADRLLLRQVVMNLLTNAVKFTRPRAVAEIEIAEAPDRARGDEVVFMVRDNGVGFDMSFADKLFGVFKRLHQPGEFEGTGIGLANVERIVSRHGGRVWGESESGKGAGFFVALPRPRPDNTPENSAT